MKRMMLGTLAAAMLLSLVTAASAQTKPAAAAKPEEKKSDVAKLHRKAYPHPARTIHGNQGFHYGLQYSAYTMHVKQNDKK
jgi:hypothetical protein